jgi:hypothetical protein
MRRRAALAALLAAAACREDPNAVRNQGEDCFSCHRPGGKAPRTIFTVAGSVFRDGSGPPLETGAAEVAVVLTGADGGRLELVSNAGGNFTSRKEIAFPAQVELRTPAAGGARRGPAGACAHGNCNLCHSPEKPGGGARGRLVRP